MVTHVVVESCYLYHCPQVGQLFSLEVYSLEWDGVALGPPGLAGFVHPDNTEHTHGQAYIMKTRACLYTQKVKHVKTLLVNTLGKRSNFKNHQIKIKFSNHIIHSS